VLNGPLTPARTLRRPVARRGDFRYNFPIEDNPAAPLASLPSLSRFSLGERRGEHGPAVLTIEREWRAAASVHATDFFPLSSLSCSLFAPVEHHATPGNVSKEFPRIPVRDLFRGQLVGNSDRRECRILSRFVVNGN